MSAIRNQVQIHGIWTDIESPTNLYAYKKAEYPIRTIEAQAPVVGLNFEVIDFSHQRAKVPGGWLVKAMENVMSTLPDGRTDTGYEWRLAMAFVPDPDHQWALK